MITKSVAYIWIYSVMQQYIADKNINILPQLSPRGSVALLCFLKMVQQCFLQNSDYK